MTWTDTQRSLYDLDDDYLRVIARGPKGAGKTRAGVWGFLSWAMRNHENRTFGIAARSLPQWRSVIMKEVNTWGRAAGYPGKSPVKTTASGFTIGSNEFLRLIGNNTEAVSRMKGLNLSGSLADEPNEQPLEFIEELDFRVRVGHPRKMVYMYNPEGTKHWMESDYWDRPTAIDARLIQFELDDNPALDAEYKEGLEKKYLPGTAKHRRYVLGLPADNEGLVYKHVSTGNPKVALADKLYVTVDAGNSLDHPTHALLIGVWPTVEWVLDEHRYPTVDEDTERTPDEIAKDILAAFKPWGRIVGVIVDPAALYLIHAFKRLGVRAIAGDNRKKIGIEVTDSYLTRSIVRVSNKCGHLLAEMSKYVWDKTNDGRFREREPVKKDDHGPDALRYYCMYRNNRRAVRMSKPIFD